MGVNILTDKFEKNSNFILIRGGENLLVQNDMMYVGISVDGKYSIAEYNYEFELNPFLNRNIPIATPFYKMSLHRDVLMVEGNAMKSLILARVSKFLLEDSRKLATTYLNVHKTAATIFDIKGKLVYVEQSIYGTRLYLLSKKFAGVKCEGITQLNEFGMKKSKLTITGLSCKGNDNPWGGCVVNLPVQVEFYEKFTMESKKAKGFGLAIAFFTVLLLVSTIFGLMYKNYKSKLAKAEKYLVEVSSTYMEVSIVDTPKPGNQGAISPEENK